MNISIPNVTRVILVSGIVVGLALVPVFFGSFVQRQIVEFLYFLALAQIWNLLAGYVGLVTIGMQVWVGIGAYTLVVAAEDYGIDPFVAVAISGIVAALFTLITSPLLFRLNGAYFAVGSWILAETVRLGLVMDQTHFGGGGGRTLSSLSVYSRHLREDITYYIALAAVIGTIGIIVLLLRSRMGSALRTMRAGNSGPSGVGINVPALKISVFVLAGGLAGIFGAIIYLNIINVRPDSAFSINWVAYPLFIAVIGGIGTLEGPIIGTIIFFMLREFLHSYEELSLIAFGTTAILTMYFAPQGLWGVVKEKTGLSLFVTHKSIPKRFMKRG